MYLQRKRIKVLKAHKETVVNTATETATVATVGILGDKN